MVKNDKKSKFDLISSKNRMKDHFHNINDVPCVYVYKHK